MGRNRARSRRDLMGVRWVCYSLVETWGRRRHLGDECRIVNVAEVGEVVARQARG